MIAVSDGRRGKTGSGVVFLRSLLDIEHSGIDVRKVDAPERRRDPGNRVAELVPPWLDSMSNTSMSANRLKRTTIAFS